MKATFLIVDDEAAIGRIIAFQLENSDYACELATSGAEALSKASMKDFEVVLLDIDMPVMSGLQVLEKIVNDHPDTAVVMLTGIDNTATAVDAMRKGAYDYILKPFNLDDLTIRVGMALDKRRLILENRDYERRLEQKVKIQASQIAEISEDLSKRPDVI